MRFCGLKRKYKNLQREISKAPVMHAIQQVRDVVRVLLRNLYSGLAQLMICSILATTIPEK